MWARHEDRMAEVGPSPSTVARTWSASSLLIARASWSCNSSSPLLCGHACSASGGGPEPTAAEEAGNRKTLRHRWTRDQKTGTHSQKWAAAQNPAQIPFTPKWPLRAKLGEKVIEPEFREEQRPAPPLRTAAANKARPECRRTAGSRPPEEPPCFPRLGELPIEQTRASISRQNCSPGRNSWNLKGKAESVQVWRPTMGTRAFGIRRRARRQGERPH